MIDIKMKVKGWYRCVLNEGTDREKDTGWFPNLVLDRGLDNLGTNTSSIIPQVSIGTGSTAVAAGQVGLAAFHARTSNYSLPVTVSNLGAPTYGSQNDCAWTFAQGAVVGNMTEVGAGLTDATNTMLFSRALIVDGAGTPTALTVVALDTLTVYYRLIVYPPLTDLVSSVVIQGVTYNFTGRLASAATFTYNANNNNFFGEPLANNSNSYPAGCTIGTTLTNPSGAATTFHNSAVTAAYVSNTRYKQTTITVPPANGNPAGGIQGLRLVFGILPGASFQYVFTSAIPKDNTKTMTLVVRFSWSR